MTGTRISAGILKALIFAGRDIYDTSLVPGSSPTVPVLTLGGPGTFDIEAGRNIGPLSNPEPVACAKPRVHGAGRWHDDLELERRHQCRQGAKSAADVPPPIYACDINHYCTVDARGEVSGAGIATLQTILGRRRAT